jgi:NADH dehydrogenase
VPFGRRDAAAPHERARRLRIRAERLPALEGAGRGGAAPRAAGILPYPIFRPSVVFGEGDRFLNLFAKLAHLFPGAAARRGRARFQPIWVEDVARCFVGALGDPRTFGQVYELCGPKAYTLAELVRFAAEATVIRAASCPCPRPRAHAGVFPRAPARQADDARQPALDERGQRVRGAFPRVFGFEPATLEAVALQYLAGGTSRDRYNR